MKLKLTNITKKFFSLRGVITALDDISITVPDNSFFVLLGPSGCGKSTLLNLIAGLEKPTCGEIWFDDSLVFSFQKRLFIPTKERNVAMVFQSYALYPHLSVFENIAFPLRIARSGKNAIKEAVINIASTLGISNLLEAKPGELSGGQRQRVAIGRAIVRQPSIFLLDEPLSNLDAQLRVSTRAELKDLQRRLGITTIYVTHDQVEAMTLGDKIAILKNGRVEQIGTSEELYNKPTNTFVATFIGTPPMNLLKTLILQEGQTLFIIIGDQKLILPGKIQNRLKNLKRTAFTLGIRPEHIHVCSISSRTPDRASTLSRQGSNMINNRTFRARIISIESLGREFLLHLSTDKLKLSSLADEKYFSEGDLVEVSIDLNKIHLFS